MIKYSILVFALVALLGGLVFASAGGGERFAGGSAVINLGPINPPNIGWGQSAQFNAYVSKDNRPLKNMRVEFWFSGQHGIQSAHWTVRTNAEGRATVTKAIPRDWKDKTKWVDLNVSSDDAGVAKYWRIKS